MEMTHSKYRSTTAVVNNLIKISYYLRELYCLCSIAFIIKQYRLIGQYENAVFDCLQYYCNKIFISLIKEYNLGAQRQAEATEML